LLRQLTYLLLLLAYVGGQNTLRAQGRKQQVMIGVGLMAQTFIGDLTPANEVFTRWYPGMNFSLQFDSRRLLSPQINFAFSDFVAQDRNLGAKDGRQPNRFAHVTYFSADFRLRVRFLRKSRIRPHLGVGIGFLTFSVKDEKEKSLLNNISSRALNERYASTSAILPFNAGFTWKLSPIISTGIDVTYSLCLSDYIDNVGKLGNRRGPDSFFTFQFSLYATIPSPERKTRLN
jgi:hypothetical protein